MRFQNAQFSTIAGDLRFNNRLIQINPDGINPASNKHWVTVDCSGLSNFKDLNTLCDEGVRLLLTLSAGDITITSSAQSTGESIVPNHRFVIATEAKLTVLR